MHRSVTALWGDAVSRVASKQLLGAYALDAELQLADDNRARHEVALGDGPRPPPWCANRKAQVGVGSADNPSMDISGIASLATQLSEQRTSLTAAVLVQKKAMDSQQSNALTLIASVTPVASLPAHIGQNVNTVA